MRRKALQGAGRSEAVQRAAQGIAEHCPSFKVQYGAVRGPAKCTADHSPAVFDVPRDPELGVVLGHA